MAALTTFALVGTAVAAVASAGAALVGGMQQASVARYNAKLNDMNSKTAKEQAAADEATYRARAERAKAAQIAAYGASGVTLAGSPLDVIEDTEVQIEKEALGIRYKGDVTANRYDNEAQNQRYRARSAMAGAYIGAGTALLSGAGKIAGAWPSSGSTSDWFTSGLRG